MIINLRRNILEFIISHNLSVMDIEYVSYISKEDGSLCSCDFSELIDIAEDINFEDHDPLIKHREQLNQNISIVADEWYITRSTDPAAIWEYHQLPPTGKYKELYEEDLIDPNDVIDKEVVELLAQDSYNMNYVRDHITILNKEYRIENADGIEQVVNDKNEVGVILACNPRGQYWSQYTSVSKDPQLLFYPELIKIVMEYHGEHGSSAEDNLVKRSDADIGSVFKLEDIAKEYNLDITGFDQNQFNNLKVEFVPKGYDYQISFTGAASHYEIRHEIISYLKPTDIIKL